MVLLSPLVLASLHRVQGRGAGNAYIAAKNVERLASEGRLSFLRI